jgi:hypothetical protein
MRRCSRSCPTRSASPPAERQGDLLASSRPLTSTENLTKVVRRTDLNLLVGSERDLAAQVEKLRENIKVTAQQDNLFEISAPPASAASPTPRMPAHPPDRPDLLDLFVEENLSGDRAETGQTADLPRRGAAPP